MKTVFLGTPEIAVPTLDRLFSDGHEMLLAVSQPDRPAGRGRKTAPTPVKKRATALGIPVLQFDDVNAPEALVEIRRQNPDVIVVVAFGQLLKRELLETPPFGCVNLHASLLPLLRGAAPISRAVMEGLPFTGLTTMRMTRRMDAGEIYLKSEKIPIGPRTTSGDLEAEMKTVGAVLMSETIRRLGTGTLTPVPQDESLATFAKKIEALERKIDWSLPAEVVDRRIRGLSPNHAAYTFFKGNRLQILRSELCAGAGAAPGTILSEDLEVGAGNGRLRILEVRPEGKNAMTASEWARGARVAANVDRLGEF